MAENPVVWVKDGGAGADSGLGRAGCHGGVAVGRGRRSLGRGGAAGLPVGVGAGSGGEGAGWPSAVAVVVLEEGERVHHEGGAEHVHLLAAGADGVGPTQGDSGIGVFGSPTCGALAVVTRSGSVEALEVALPDPRGDRSWSVGASLGRTPASPQSEGLEGPERFEAEYDLITRG